MKGSLTKYFNKDIISGIAARSAITGLISTVTLLGLAGYSYSPVLLGCAAVTAAVSAGYMNRWNEAVTGQLLWKPKTPFYGL